MKKLIHPQNIQQYTGHIRTICKTNSENFIKPKQINYRVISPKNKKSNYTKSYISDNIKNNQSTIIYCPYNRVKTYTELIKNSNMQQIAVVENKKTKAQKKISIVDITFLILVGIIIGFINGFFGGGGGMICVPLLIYLLKLKDKIAHATAILIMLPISLVSSIIYFFNINIELNVTLFVILGSIIGGIIGAFLLKKLSNIWIRAIFSIVMILAGIKMIF